MKLSADVDLDLQRLITTRMLLQANSGGGKSWALRRILEQSHGEVQQIVIDVEDEFYTLFRTGGRLTQATFNTL